MTISVQHNPNGSITVSCGSDTLTFFPGSGAGAGAGGGSGPAVIPVIDPDDDPLVGWPLPGALVARMSGKTLPGVQILRVQVDPVSGALRWSGDAQARLRTQAAAIAAGEAIPLNIDAPLGQRYDLGPVAAQIRQLQAEIHRRVLPYLTTGGLPGL